MTATPEKIAGVVRPQLERLLAEGGSFGDARFYAEDANQRLMLYDGNLESNTRTDEQGIGVRVLWHGAWGFAATADLDAIPACFDRALANARAAAQLPGFPKDMGPARPSKGEYVAPVEKDPFDVPLADKLAFLKGLDEQLKGEGIAQRVVSARFQRRRIHYWNTEGTEVSRRVMNTFATMMVMAPDKDGRTQRRSVELNSDGAGTRGWEWLADENCFAGHAERIKQDLAAILAAEPLPPGRRDLIILPGQGFLQVHETIGHALELDRILGYELSFAGGSHVRPEMIGKLRYGSDKLNCRAGVTANSPGTFGYDDEGTPQRDYYLIKEGILVNVLSSRTDLGEANARAGREVVKESGTAARACAFYRTPIDRMTNINIDAGPDGTLDDIVRATEDGIIVDTPVSWSIGSNREHFHFGTEIAWEVKDGKRGRVFKNTTYQGHTLEFWNSLDKVGDESTWKLQSVPNCGKGEPNQIMELGHGIPVMRFKNVQTGEKE
ncbi:TldD/PmbA family protein [candidate division WOR-3 bacterium]|nr:TldD/PmbA family protein [candidate division WOR-3 bacterium]